MSELVAFLEARLAEDEQMATGAFRWPWDYYADGKVLGVGQNRVAERVPSWNGVHIARHDPARVLREVTAKRTILAAYVAVTEASERNTAEHTRASAGWPDTQDRIYQLRTHGWQLSGRLEGLEVALRALALPFSDHPDFQEQWR